MTVDDLPEPPPRRRFAARRVRGYFVFGPIPPRSRWLEPVGRVILTLMLPFWIYTPALALWFLAIQSSDASEEVILPALFGFAAIAVAAGVYPLATWPCRWPFRLVASFVWAALLGVIGFPWSLLIVSYLE
ncbi:hypothetical protein [Alienimonas californiensis]|uniref:Uncharacterized protein n=1 Tax=Alienimonas californiensis TaxID=2527989 RepID=A0A517PD84_9PLAN|nr:hypothetical protein [Alienimonas californiensis]QDT17335.1 hypothetical protein CA12_34550 [Alienimonas californiensis]